jgi:hypothetical protein
MDAKAIRWAALVTLRRAIKWGDLPAALNWLDKALQLRDPGLVSLK